MLFVHTGCSIRTMRSANKCLIMWNHNHHHWHYRPLRRLSSVILSQADRWRRRSDRWTMWQWQHQSSTMTREQDFPPPLIDVSVLLHRLTHLTVNLFPLLTTANYETGILRHWTWSWSWWRCRCCRLQNNLPYCRCHHGVTTQRHLLQFPEQSKLIWDRDNISLFEIKSSKSR